MNTIDQSKTNLSNSQILDVANGESFSHHNFHRVYAKEVTFFKVSFEKSFFNECYFRNCKFVSCNFTGARIKDSNFRGSHFTGCTLHYSNWDKTYVEEGILNNLSAWENVSRDVVRSLRVNFSQMGNPDGVNRAAMEEMWLTQAHLKKRLSKEGYHFSKLEGKPLDRALACCQFFIWWCKFAIWGHGEIFWVPLIWIFLTPAICTVLAILWHWRFNFQFACDHFSAFLGALLGIDSHAEPLIIVSVLTIWRIVLMGLFASSLFRRISRR